ncbi:hypothetical protein CsatB_030800 [Cannabis sativa]
MAEKRVKTSSSEDGEDRISKLPDATIKHILSFLPTKDVVRTSFLSKRWKLMWYSVPTLYFPDLSLTANYVDNYLQHRKRGIFFMGDSVITRLEIREFCYDYETSLCGPLDKLLAFAVENKVKEIIISFFINFSFYSLPDTVVVNAVCLTILELCSVKLNSRCSFSFPSLKSLFMFCLPIVMR